MRAAVCLGSSQAPGPLWLGVKHSLLWGARGVSQPSPLHVAKLARGGEKGQELPAQSDDWRLECPPHPPFLWPAAKA